MTANVANSNSSPIPAGIFLGIEAFWYNDEKWVIAHGSAMRFHECDSTIQQPIWKAFLNDKKSLAYIAKMGVKKASEVFDVWYRCVVGGLDHVPDFNDGKFTPDAFNNLCSIHACPHRGRLCSCESGLSNYDVETIEAMKTARTLEQAATKIHLSLPAIKSRVIKLHEKFNVTSSVSMMARAVKFGI